MKTIASPPIQIILSSRTELFNSLHAFTLLDGMPSNCDAYIFKDSSYVVHVETIRKYKIAQHQYHKPNKPNEILVLDNVSEYCIILKEELEDKVSPQLIKQMSDEKPNVEFLRNFNPERYVIDIHINVDIDKSDDRILLNFSTTNPSPLIPLLNFYKKYLMLYFKIKKGENLFSFYKEALEYFSTAELITHSLIEQKESHYTEIMLRDLNVRLKFSCKYPNCLNMALYNLLTNLLLDMRKAQQIHA